MKVVRALDYSAHILEQCRSNVDRNRASVDFSAAESGKGPSGTDVRIRTLDWYSGGILPGWKKVEPPEATASGNKTFEWDADDLLLLREDCLIVAADGKLAATNRINTLAFVFSSKFPYILTFV